MKWTRYPHSATYEEREVSIVDMETVVEVRPSEPFVCEVEPLEPDVMTNAHFVLENPKFTISWPPIEGKVLQAGDRVTYDGQAYLLQKITADIYQEDPYFAAYLCGESS